MMLSDEEKKAINQLKADTSFYDYELKNGNYIYELFKIEVYKKNVDVILNLIKKQQKEIEELKETLKCTQNSWYEDTKIVDKIKSEIEELKLECENCSFQGELCDELNSNNNCVPGMTILILQSLLEKE